MTTGVLLACLLGKSEMCGFLVSYNGNSNLVRSQLETLTHRGPDSTHFVLNNDWSFGFNRLAIVGSDEANQPYTENDHVKTLIFNGEIYNYRELQKKYLQSISKSSSDTQVLYRLLSKYGERILSELDGIYSIIFINQQSGDCIIARDEFGVKPLYYCHCDGATYFCSETKPLRHLSNASIKKDNLCEYLSFGAPLLNNTIYDCIYEFPSGHYATDVKLIDKKKVKKNQVSRTHELNIDELYGLITRSVLSQSPKIEFGTLFSGGIDSSILLNILKEDENMQSALCINVDHPEMSEKKWQLEGLTTINFQQQTDIIEQTKKDFSLDNLKIILPQIDIPICHPNYIGALALSKRARAKNLKVLISGEGADELFFGYKWNIDDAVSNLTAQSYLPHAIVSKIFEVPTSDFSFLNSIHKREFFLLYYLKKWLLRADVTGMANSVEIRVPFLSSDLTSYAANLSFNDLTDYGCTPKYPLKVIAEKIYGKNYAFRKKTGFDYPLNTWITKEHVEYLRDHNDMFSPEMITMICENKEQDYFFSRIIFVLVSYLIWLNAQ